MLLTNVRITVYGCVQGVGFRPFVFRLAKQYQLTGHIRNTSNGVSIDVQGSEEDLAHFQKDLIEKKPKGARIDQYSTQGMPPSAADHFTIEKSEENEDVTLALLPDSAICSECLKEFNDPQNRRYRYPFLHCMSCGPRFSLFLRMPFDRENTTMTDFPKCNLCQKEYNDPFDRRFFSQTNCCPQCGPKLRLYDPKQKPIADEKQALETAISLLREGKILALKNTGGYLLLADATNTQAVERLRKRKKRAKKPFALLMPDIAFVKEAAHLGECETEVLTSPAAPIVLLKKRAGFSLISPAATFESPYFGVMLPHNALQYLLLEALDRPLIATSGNISGNPLCITESEAFSQLSSVADAFLVHNRRIMHRLDDSIVQIIENRPMIIRRARGYIPCAFSLPGPLTQKTLATGSHLKNTFAFGKDKRIYLSQHMGDLDTIDTCKAYDREIESWENLLQISPTTYVCDQHPDYYSSQYLQKQKIPSHPIQHHKAHVYSGMLDQNLSPPLLGISWDGTGLGEDPAIWGGEAFIVSEKGIQRFASLIPFRLPGSEKAIHEPRRAALGALYELQLPKEMLINSEFPDPEGFRGKNRRWSNKLTIDSQRFTKSRFWPERQRRWNGRINQRLPKFYEQWASSVFSKEELSILTTTLEKGINAPFCSSMGRLFDVVSAILGSCTISDYEGHAALTLEALANQADDPSFHYTLSLLKKKDMYLLDWREMVKQILQDKENGQKKAEIALAFHQALADAIVTIAQKAGLSNVLLTGGVMQNKLLAEKAIKQLREAGFTPFWHEQIPPGDGGLAAGQIMGHFLEENGCV